MGGHGETNGFASVNAVMSVILPPFDTIYDYPARTADHIRRLEAI